MRFLVLALAATLTATAALRAQPQPLVAPTGPLTPAQERVAFIVPAGFEVQLVAAEPDIQKPIQMAFDARGRLWVTTSYHYPFAAETGQGTDKLFVLSDFGPDGKARKVTTFAADLNIPIGILPLPDCDSCIVSSVGQILKLTDTDGDGKADKREVLFAGFGAKDTHGMYNSFTLMPDGWVYACHGFANESTVKGKDGHEVKMQSGHTFRFRPDGSRIEVYTRGQVNPFGMAVDPWFNLYTADCHSKPITQLIPGAYYQSFGKPHDGLGFAPHATPHDHGSTALCGLAWYEADHFPKEYRGTMFLGNVVTNRVNCDRIEWRGSSPVAKEQPDFLVSKDPWFRPSDIKLGPDGALYVADFYNKIIGHYEVDLKHPGRDKERGRVWRVVWKGEPGASAPGAPPKMAFEDLTKETASRLIKLSGDPNLTVRLFTTNELTRRGRIREETEGQDTSSKWELALRMCHGGWAGFRSGEITAEQIADVVREGGLPNTFGEDGAVLLSVHALKALATTEHTPPIRSAVISALMQKPRVARAAVEAMAAHPHQDFVKPLIELIQKCPAEDNHLKHAARIALRNCIRGGEGAPGSWEAVWELPADKAAVVADVALGIPQLRAAAFLAAQIKAGRIPNDRMAPFAEHIGRHGDQPERLAIINRVVDWKDGRAQAMAVLSALVRGVQAGGRWPFLDDEVGALLTRTRAELEGSDRDSRLAALKLLTDLPGALKPGYRFDGNSDADPRPAVAGLVGDAAQPDDVRAAAVEALIRLDPKAGRQAAEKLIVGATAPVPLREKAAVLLIASADRNDKLAGAEAIASVPYRSAVVVATALAASSEGANILLDAVKWGKAPAGLLQEKAVIDRLKASGAANVEKRVADLTRGLPPADKKLAALIQQRSNRFASGKPDKEAGAKLFIKHCGACHQIGGQGGKVGPQLDGIGNRGLERLLEDTLDPNRNVDAAFRARVLTLTDGTTKTGLMLRVEGEVLVMADAEGKEFRVPTKEIEANRETTLSPMPGNFGEVIPEADFFHLMAYLLEQKAPPPKK